MIISREKAIRGRKKAIAHPKKRSPPISSKDFSLTNSCALSGDARNRVSFPVTQLTSDLHRRNPVSLLGRQGAIALWWETGRSLSGGEKGDRSLVGKRAIALWEKEAIVLWVTKGDRSLRRRSLSGGKQVDRFLVGKKAIALWWEKERSLSGKKSDRSLGKRGDRSLGDKGRSLSEKAIALWGNRRSLSG
ncbi:MAG: hypothetical protein F6J93_18800 [Oscillatoria sp. SIO1A7]|nr:hypothetical protein [Oscillatoria sp. SIO1A7]